MKVIYLLALLPNILKYGRRAYRPSSVAGVEQGVAVNDDDAEDRSVTTAIETTASHFDVHLVIASWLYEAVIIIACAFARTKPEYLFCMYIARILIYMLTLVRSTDIFVHLQLLPPRPLAPVGRLVSTVRW